MYVPDFCCASFSSLATLMTTKRFRSFVEFGLFWAAAQFHACVGELKAEPISEEVSVLEVLGAGEVCMVKGVE